MTRIPLPYFFSKINISPDIWGGFCTGECHDEIEK